MEASLIKEEERHILKMLPILLKKDAEFRRELSVVLSETLATRDEFTRLLQEIEKNRGESNRRFEAMQRQMDERFEAVERRFEAMQRQMDERFEAVERRFEAMQKQMDERFEAMQRQMDERFEAMQRQMDERFEAMQRQMDERFEAMEKRIDDHQSWVGIVVGRFQTRAGRNLEEAVAGTLRVALKVKDIEAENITLRRKLIDKEGRIGPAGRSYEVDICVHNGRALIFEVKSCPDEEDLYRFSDKADLAIKQWKLKKPVKVVVSLEKQAYLEKTAKKLKILLA
jgi:hypothetical protein